MLYKRNIRIHNPLFADFHYSSETSNKQNDPCFDSIQQLQQEQQQHLETYLHQNKNKQTPQQNLSVDLLRQQQPHVSTSLMVESLNGQAQQQIPNQQSQERKLENNRYSSENIQVKGNNNNIENQQYGNKSTQELNKNIGKFYGVTPPSSRQLTNLQFGRTKGQIETSNSLQKPIKSSYFIDHSNSRFKKNYEAFFSGDNEQRFKKGYNQNYFDLPYKYIGKHHTYQQINPLSGKPLLHYTPKYNFKIRKEDFYELNEKIALQNFRKYQEEEQNLTDPNLYPYQTSNQNYGNY